MADKILRLVPHLSHWVHLSLFISEWTKGTLASVPLHVPVSLCIMFSSQISTIPAVLYGNVTLSERRNPITLCKTEPPTCSILFNLLYLFLFRLLLNIYAHTGYTFHGWSMINNIAICFNALSKYNFKVLLWQTLWFKLSIEYSN